jgi:hypothetical protein
MSLVGGVRSCEELPKLESCFPCSSWPRGLRLKKLFILPEVVCLLGLRLPELCGCGSGWEVGGVSMASL